VRLEIHAQFAPVRRIAIVLFSVVATACVGHSAGARRANDFGVRLRGIHRAAVFTSSVHAYEVSAGNSKTEEQETSMAAAGDLQEHAAELLRAQNVAAIRLDLPLAPETDDARALANMVWANIVEFTYIKPIPSQMAHFDYSLGPLDAMLEARQADALLIIWATSYTPTAGNIAKGMLLGGGVAKQARLGVALVDRSGEVIWFNQASIAASFDQAGVAPALLDAAFSELHP
jgi:hypothetical protein